MKKQPRKLELRHDTVRHLKPIELTQVGGGGNSYNVCDPPGSGGSCSRASV